MSTGSNGETAKRRIAHRQFIVDQIVRAADAEVGAMNFADFAHGVPAPEDPSCAVFAA